MRRQRDTSGSAGLTLHRTDCRHHRAGRTPRHNHCGPVHARHAIDSAHDRSREVVSNLALRRAGFTSSLAAPLAFSRRRIDKLPHLVVGPRRLDNRLHHALKALGDLPVVGVGPDVLHEGLDLRRVGIAGLKRLLHLEKRPVMGRVTLVGILAKRPAVFLRTKAAWPRTVALVDVVDVDGRQTARHDTRLPCGQIFPQHGPEFAAERTPCLHAAACQVIQHAQRGAVRHDRIGALALVRAPHLIYTFP